MRPAGEGPDSVALWLRRSREARGLTTREVAAAIDVSPAFITLIETGRKRPGVEKARALARVLGLPEEPLVAWVELGGRYDRRSRATSLISDYLRASEQPGAQGSPRSRASLMFSRRDAPEGLEGAVPGGEELYSGAEARPASASARGFLENLLRGRSSQPVRVRLYPEGVDVGPGTPGRPPMATITLDGALFPEDVSIERPWAYRISEDGARHAPDALAAGDLVVLTSQVGPVAAGAIHAVRLGDRIELCRVMPKGKAVVVLLAGGVELLPLPGPDFAPDELRGRVVLTVRRG